MDLNLLSPELREILETAENMPIDKIHEFLKPVMLKIRGSSHREIFTDALVQSKFFPKVLALMARQHPQPVTVEKSRWIKQRESHTFRATTREIYIKMPRIPKRLADAIDKLQLACCIIYKRGENWYTADAILSNLPNSKLDYGCEEDYDGVDVLYYSYPDAD